MSISCRRKQEVYLGSCDQLPCPPIGPGGSGRSLPPASAGARAYHVAYRVSHLTFPRTAAFQQYELIDANELKLEAPPPLAPASYHVCVSAFVSVGCVCVRECAILHAFLAASPV